MVSSSQRLVANSLLALLIIAGLAFALWPRLAANSAPTQEQTMAKTWNVTASLPPIDAAAPKQFKTATFAVG